MALPSGGPRYQPVTALAAELSQPDGIDCAILSVRLMPILFHLRHVAHLGLSCPI